MPFVRMRHAAEERTVNGAQQSRTGACVKEIERTASGARSLLLLSLTSLAPAIPEQTSRKVDESWYGQDHRSDTASAEEFVVTDDTERKKPAMSSKI